MKLKNVLFAGALALTLGACSSTTASSAPSSAASSSKDEEVVTEGHYVVANASGSKVTDLYFYKTGSEDKGTNYAEGGLEAGASVNVDITVDEAEAEGYAMTVEYTAEGGEPVVVFDNLHLEEANMYLKSAHDVEGGATPFSIVTTGTYNVTNATGAAVKELYFYQTGSEDKGTNYAADGLAADASVEVNIEVDTAAAVAGYAMTVEYVAEDGTSTVVFDNLHLEEANMYLKPAADVEGGATPFLPAE